MGSSRTVSKSSLGNKTESRGKSPDFQGEATGELGFSYESEIRSASSSPGTAATEVWVHTSPRLGVNIGVGLASHNINTFLRSIVRWNFFYRRHFYGGMKTVHAYGFAPAHLVYNPIRSSVNEFSRVLPYGSPRTPGEDEGPSSWTNGQDSCSRRRADGLLRCGNQ